MAPKRRTVIVDGEVMFEDDPRYQEYISKNRPGPAAAPSAQRGGPTSTQPQAAAAPAGFNFSAPPFRLLPQPPGSSFFAAEAEVFGRRVPVVALLVLVVMAMQFGWKAFIGVGLLLYLYQANASPTQPSGTERSAARAGASQSQAAPSGPGAALGGVANVLNSLGLGNSATGFNTSGTATQASGTGSGSTAGSKANGTGAFAGKGHKLSG